LDTKLYRPSSRLADLHLQEEFSPGAEAALEQGLKDLRHEIIERERELEALHNDWRFREQAQEPLAGALLYFQYSELADKIERLEVQLVKLRGRLRMRENHLRLFRGLKCLITSEQAGLSR